MWKFNRNSRKGKMPIKKWFKIKGERIIKWN